MSNPEIRRFYPPSFRETLTGEITIADRKTSRVTSLFQLAERAMLSDSHTVDGKFVTFLFNPEEVPNIEADVSGEMHDGFVIVDSLLYTLRRGNTYHGQFAVSTNANDTEITLNDERYKVSTPAGLAIARTDVTTVAQDFFDRAGQIE